MEYGNGIIGDMCIHMLDMVRWMLDLGWPTQRLAPPAASWSTRTARPTSPTPRRATFDFGDLNVVWQHRTWGDRARPGVPLGGDHLRRQGHAQGQRPQLRLHPEGTGRSRSTATWSTSSTSTRRTGPRRTWSGTSPRPSAATCSTSCRRSRPAASRWPTSSRATSRRPAASWPTCPAARANPGLGPGERPGRGRRRGEPPARPAVPQPLGAPGPGAGVSTQAEEWRLVGKGPSGLRPPASVLHPRRVP